MVMVGVTWMVALPDTVVEVTVSESRNVPPVAAVHTPAAVTVDAGTGIDTCDPVNVPDDGVPLRLLPLSRSRRRV